MEQYLFFFLAFVSVFSGLAVILSRNPVHSVLYLVICFFSIAGHYVLLNAQFLAVVHIIVYAGAIMVLFLFVIMLLNLNKASEPRKNGMLRFASVVSGCALALVLLAVLKESGDADGALTKITEHGKIQVIGQKLFTDYLLPFEVASILFLSAMVGVVFISKKEKVGTDNNA